MRVLVVGSGGREHALAWRLARDPEVAEVLAAPGNPGMEGVARRVDAGESDAPALAEACRRERVGLVVIGPEAPLAAGVADALGAAGFAVWGASRAAARLESSKWFAKEVMREAGVATARAEAHDDLAAARHALDRFAPPWVVKADGLAGGKGVCVTAERGEAERFLADSLAGARFGASGRRVVIEEFLAGEEASVMAVCDGRRFVLLPAARDFKRAFDGDAGPNTGGMGACAPAPGVDEATMAAVAQRVVAPVLAAMERRGAPFRGALYCGLMLGPQGPRVLEFNARLGDPESEVVLPLLGGSLARLLGSAAGGALEEDAVRVQPGAAVAVAIVDEGYPDAVRGGGRISGLEALRARGDLLVFHGGCERQGTDWVVRGGRAAYVVAQGRDRETARARAYAAIATLGGTGWRVRRDIAGEDEPPAAGAGGAQRGATHDGA